MSYARMWRTEQFGDIECSGIVYRFGVFNWFEILSFSRKKSEFILIAISLKYFSVYL